MWKKPLGKIIAYFITGGFALSFIFIILSGIYFVFFLFDQAAFAADNAGNEKCLTCHGNQELSVTKDGETMSLYVDKDKFAASTHGAFPCISCHPETNQVPHKEPVYGTKLQAQVAESCQKCHVKVAETFANSIHSKLPIGSCTACHDSHDIRPMDDPTSMVAKQSIAETCGKCHSGNVLESYQRSFHGTAVKYGYEEAATCVDCHGSHEIVMSNDPSSKVHKDNIPQTCTSCHGGEPTPNWANGKEHVVPEDRENAFPLWITWKIFIVLILFDVTKDGTIVIFELIRQLRYLRSLGRRKKVSGQKDLKA